MNMKSMIMMVAILLMCSNGVYAEGETIKSLLKKGYKIVAVYTNGNDYDGRYVLVNQSNIYVCKPVSIVSYERRSPGLCDEYH